MTHTDTMSNSDSLRAAKKCTWIGFWSNLALSVIKIIAGLIGRSGALIADGVHSMSDLVSDVLVLAMVNISHKSPDQDHPFGHGKYETLAALLLSALLIAVAGGIFWEGLSKIISVAKGEILPKPGIITLIVCVISILCKEWLYRYTRRVGEKIHSEAIIANAWHHRSDAFSSVATLAGVAGAIYLGDRWHILDPLAAILVAIFIAIVGIRMIIGAGRDLLGEALPADEQKLIKTAVTETDGVITYHHLRTTRSGADCIIEIHLKVDPQISVNNAHAISTAVEHNIKRILSQANSVFVSTHIEPYLGQEIMPDGSCK